MHYIKVNYIRDTKAILILSKGKREIFKAEAFVGKNGITTNHIEGDGKTPLGIYELGMIFGTHPIEEVQIENYIQINDELYWVDDIDSKYYNKLVNIKNVKKDWTSAEHLIDYPKRYEYAIEIKTNPQNIKGKGSAIFLHCSINEPTHGCIAIDREAMKKIINFIKSEGKDNLNIQISKGM